jgi:hypothetical protein
LGFRVRNTSPGIKYLTHQVVVALGILFGENVEEKWLDVEVQRLVVPGVGRQGDSTREQTVRGRGVGIHVGYTLVTIHNSQITNSIYHQSLFIIHNSQIHKFTISTNHQSLFIIHNSQIHYIPKSPITIDYSLFTNSLYHQITNHY